MKKLTILGLGILLAVWDYGIWVSWNIIMRQPFSASGGTGIIYIVSFGVTVIYILKVATMMGEVFKNKDDK